MDAVHKEVQCFDTSGQGNHSLSFLLWCFINMRLGVYALVLFLTMDLHRIEGHNSVVLRRVKRRWISATFKLVEEDPGPYPKKAIQLSNDRSQNTTLLFAISGEGVETGPERGLFSVNPKSGEIFIHRKVDREKTRELVFQVNALKSDDLTPADMEMFYKIVVIDINDNAPVFSQQIYKFNVSENTHPGDEVFKVKATDPDDEKIGNGKISYTIVSQKPAVPSNMFEINSENGSILLRRCLDYDAIKFYSLVIEARDNGEKVLSSSAEVQINVIDGNNNPPIFTQKSASGNINETDKDVVVLRLSVTDKDSPNTPAWRAKYKIIEGNENENYKFETDPETNDGILFLIKSLDYEGGPVRKIKITVENEEPLFTCPGMKDKVSEVLQNITAVITVKDMNDPPVFNPSILIANEIEGQKLGKVLGRFNATDTDKFYKHSIRYERGFEPAEWVTVDSETGVVSTVKVLDRESPYVNNSVYTFTVYGIEDGEIPSTGTGTMSIFLSDVNDNLPYLATTHQEMCDDGEVPFITVEAGDDDLDPFSGPFTFELLDNEQHIKDKWKLGKATDSTVQLVREKKIPIGNYNVPFKIRDRQGITQESSLNLHVCYCLNGRTCPTPKAGTAILGGAAIGILFASLLLLLLGFCLLLFCIFTKKKAQNPSPFNEPTWTLIAYNEEGGNAKNPGMLTDVDGILRSIDGSYSWAKRNYPETLPYGSGTSQGYGSKALAKSHYLGSSSHVGGVFGSSNNFCSYGSKAQGTRKYSETLPYGSGTSQGYGSKALAKSHYLGSSSHEGVVFRSNNTFCNYGSKTQGTRKYSDIFPYGGGTLRPINTSQGHGSKAWAKRLYLGLDTDDVEVSNKPHVYSYEGEELCASSLDPISIHEDGTDSDYLNDLGPKFIPLARVCQQNYPQ
ncbi:cadherin-like protein 26 [Heptranchias perlo]|uniref:cadherin-like protein 26 n=1 Tax=Heptranchias perlo TaxID=212740 RepID=UPI00355A3E66